MICDSSSKSILKSSSRRQKIQHNWIFLSKSSYDRIYFDYDFSLWTDVKKMSHSKKIFLSNENDSIKYDLKNQRWNVDYDNNWNKKTVIISYRLIISWNAMHFVIRFFYPICWIFFQSYIDTKLIMDTIIEFFFRLRTISIIEWTFISMELFDRKKMKWCKWQQFHHEKTNYTSHNNRELHESFHW